jgi:hypothetical protein
MICPVRQQRLELRGKVDDAAMPILGRAGVQTHRTRVEVQARATIQSASLPRAAVSTT